MARHVCIGLLAVTVRLLRHLLGEQSLTGSPAVSQNAEADTRRATDLLALDRAKTSFFSSTSHELRCEASTRLPLLYPWLTPPSTEDAPHAHPRPLGGHSRAERSRAFQRCPRSTRNGHAEREPVRCALRFFLFTSGIDPATIHQPAFASQQGFFLLSFISREGSNTFFTALGLLFPGGWTHKNDVPPAQAGEPWFSRASNVLWIYPLEICRADLRPTWLLCSGTRPSDADCSSMSSVPTTRQTRFPPTSREILT